MSQMHSLHSAKCEDNREH